MSEIEELKQTIRRLSEKLQRLEKRLWTLENVSHKVAVRYMNFEQYLRFKNPEYTMTDLSKTYLIHRDAYDNYYDETYKYYKKKYEQREELGDWQITRK